MFQFIASKVSVIAFNILHFKLLHAFYSSRVFCHFLACACEDAALPALCIKIANKTAAEPNKRKILKQKRGRFHEQPKTKMKPESKTPGRDCGKTRECPIAVVNAKTFFLNSTNGK